MKINIIKTGSSGNCIVATYSDKKQIIFDFGKGVFKDFTLSGGTFKNVERVLISHAHNDHIGDFEKISHLNKKPSELKILRFPILHNIENYGFAVANFATKEIFYYLTDFYEVPEDSREVIIKCLRMRNFKHFAGIELSYFKFFEDKLSEEQKYGLKHHCDDVYFFELVKEFLAENPKLNIITLHASQRGDLSTFTKTGWNGSVCPPDFAKKMLYRRVGVNARFGEAGGFIKNYNYFEN